MIARVVTNPRVWIVLALVGWMLALGAGAYSSWKGIANAKANCQEIEQIKKYVRFTVHRAGALRASLDFKLSDSDMARIKAQDVETIKTFKREACPRK